PVLHRAAHLRHQVLRNVNCKPASVVPAIQNVAPVLLARQTSRAVLAPARTAAEAQRAENRRPQVRHLALQPANQLCGRLSRANHSLCVSHGTPRLQAKPAVKKRSKPRFQRTILPFATETRLSLTDA